jgi:hypothetical protein
VAPILEEPVKSKVDNYDLREPLAIVQRGLYIEGAFQRGFDRPFTSRWMGHQLSNSAPNLSEKKTRHFP